MSLEEMKEAEKTLQRVLRERERDKERVLGRQSEGQRERKLTGRRLGELVAAR